MIQKLANAGDKILDVGYGDFPILVDLLNKKGYDTHGIDPFAKEFDNKTTFRCKIGNLPSKIEKLKFNVILINMTYTLEYVSNFSKNFKWELEHKRELIEKLSRMLEKDGHLLLVDYIGTIFSKKDLQKYFRTLLFEKGIKMINFDTNKIEDFQRITVLRKKYKAPLA